MNHFTFISQPQLDSYVDSLNINNIISGSSSSNRSRLVGVVVAAVVVVEVEKETIGAGH